jgi:hypothetical protein
MAFIKLDRNIVDSYCFANPNHLKVWLWLLVKANFKKNYVPLQVGKGTTTILIDRGQLIFGRFVAEKELKMNGSMIYRILKKFEDLGQIIIEPNNQYSVITICKYDSYQNNNTESEQQLNNQCTTNEQPMNNECIADEQSLNILKEGLEGKEGKEVVIYSKQNLKQQKIPSLDEVKYAFRGSGGNDEMAEIFFNKHESTNWNLNGSPIFHFKSLIPNFITNFNQIKNARNQSSNKSANKSISSVASANFEALRNWADQFSDDHPNSNAK